MDGATLIDWTTGLVVVGGTIWALLLLLFLGLARSASLADDEIEAYVAEELRALHPQDDFDVDARSWIASERKVAS